MSSELSTACRLLLVVWLSDARVSSLETNATLLLPESSVPVAPSPDASVCWTSATSEELDREERLRLAVERIGPPKSAFWRARIVDHNAKSWDKFYHSHGSDFFHDRGWLERDFPVLRRALRQNFRLLEFGCGTGASFLPLLERLPRLRVTAFDFSARAISLAQNHPTYVNNAHRACAFVGDGAAEGGVVEAIAAAHCAHFPPNSETASFDAVLMLYMISAMPLETHTRIFMNAADCLKPGGLLMLRDYGHGDEAQTRFGRGAKFCEDGSVMVRRDGTLAAFLRIEDLARAAAAAGLEETGYDGLVAPAALSNLPRATVGSMPAPSAPTSGLSYLYRTYSNRATGENLQRVWVHGIWRKPSRVN